MNITDLITLKLESVGYWIQVHILLLQIISFVISVLLLFGTIYYVFKSGYFSLRFERFLDVLGSKNLTKRRSVQAWKQIGKRLKIGEDAQIKLAIIEADKVFEEVLKKAGYAGDTMADRLKNITPAELPNIEDVWQAHKLRNRIAHEPDFIITQGEADVAIKIYEEALKEFGFLSS